MIVIQILVMLLWVPTTLAARVLPPSKSRAVLIAAALASFGQLVQLATVFCLRALGELVSFDFWVQSPFYALLFAVAGILCLSRATRTANERAWTRLMLGGVANLLVVVLLGVALFLL